MANLSHDDDYSRNPPFAQEKLNDLILELPDFRLSTVIQQNNHSFNLSLSRLCPVDSIHTGVDSSYYCDCHNIFSPVREYRLLMVNNLSTTDISFNERTKLLKEFERAIVLFDSIMVDVASTPSPDEIMDVINQYKIPNAHFAVIPGEGRNFDRLFRRMGLHDGEEVKAEWSEFINAAKNGSFSATWESMIDEELIIELTPSKYDLTISDLDPAAVFAAFFNNSPSPRAASAAKFAHSYIDAQYSLPVIIEGREAELEDIAAVYNHELTVEDARLILNEINDDQERYFDYFKGRRMKLNLNASSKGVTHAESFDRCAFEGAAQQIIERLRRSGKVSSFIDYKLNEKGWTYGEVLEEKMW